MNHHRKFLFIVFLLNINISYSLLSDNNQSNEYLGSTGKHLFHFVQVTDIHVTHVGRTDLMKQFEQFCNEIIKTLVKPQVTVVSGDLVNSAGGLTDNRGRILRSGQYEQEWNIYRNMLNRTSVTKYTKWLDIKGNHDAFMDPDPDSSNSFYRIYSHQGHNHSGSYAYTLKTNDGDIYSFVSVDMCPRPGVGRPFNFFGRISKKEMKNLVELSEQTKTSTSIIFFGHYPLSFTYSSGIDQIMKHGLVYLNGHLHSRIKHLYARHSNGLLEVELGDWKRQRQFRIVTIDGGLISFEDFRFSQSIYAVISNPKAAKFKTPREPLVRLSQSTHIRILVFAQLPISHLKISIDKQYIGSGIRSIDNPNLFILPWNTSLYNDENLHQISVEIKDKGNNTVNISHEFSLSLSTDVSRDQSKILLSIHIPTYSFVIFISSLCMYILILLFYRYQTKQKQFNFSSRCTLWNKFSQRMTLLCSIDLIYYSLLGFAVYNFIGPWYIGYLTEGHFGSVFLWGILIQGVYLPPDAQIFTGTAQLYFFLFPLTFNLSSSCFYRYKQLQSNTNLIQLHLNRCFKIYSVYVVFAFTLLFIFLWSFIMTASFKLSWIISPFGLILPIYSTGLYIKSRRLRLEDFKLKSLTKTNGLMNVINPDGFKLIDIVDDKQSFVRVNKSQ